MNPWKAATGVLTITTVVSTGAAVAFWYQRNYAMHASRYLFQVAMERGVVFDEFDKIAIKEAKGDASWKKKRLFDPDDKRES